MARERRHLIPYEVIAIIALALAPIPAAVPIAVPLLVAGSISRWMRGRSWAEVQKGPAWLAGVGILAGAIALGVALLAGSQSLTALFAGISGDTIVEMSDLATSSGRPMTIALTAVAVAMTAIAAELALRGWIVERVLELSPGSPVLPVLVGALAEAMVTPGDVPTRVGAAILGAGLGWIYAAAGRSTLAPMLARITFQVGAVVFAALRLV
jgi:hypothetical protein